MNPADKVEKWSIDKLIPYARNARTHSDEQVAQIAASIKEWGWTTPILVDEEGGIIAGHGRTLAAQRLKMTELPVMVATGWSEAKKRAYVIADNKLALNADWDNQMLALELAEIGELGFDLDLTGFSPDEIAALMPIEITEGLTDEDEVPEAPEPITKLGDIWILGNHRLMCGDSTSIDAVEKLVDSVKIDLCYTDPPYGINEKGDRSKRKGSKSLSDGVQYQDFKDDSIDYAVEAYQIVEGVLQIPRQVWWGANYYCHALPQSNNWFVWDKRVEEKQKDTQSDCELAWIKSTWSSVRIFRHLWKGLIKGSEHGQKRVHPTQKPVALAEWSFDYFRTVKTVLDLFGGSGSTLIACEKTGRQCYMMEFEPYYCDVIVKRWENFTGKKAAHAETNQPFAEVKDDKQEATH
jgi:DNA modification methylase